MTSITLVRPAVAFHAAFARVTGLIEGEMAENRH
jgi:hypothetical protein